MNAPIFPESPEMIRMVPVSMLVSSEKNVRKTGGQSIDELAASIRAHGLLQNLSAYAIDKGHPTYEVVRFEVVAGNRRLRAIKQLIDEGHLPEDYQVPVRMVDRNDATSVSLAENVVREAMNPADQVLAFKQMADSMSPAEIADAFGVSEVTVQRRLALANVAPALLDAYRDGEVTLEKLQALALTDDHAVQLEVWEKCKSEYDDADDIRRLLVSDGSVASKDRLARYVTVEAYEAAGGKVMRDLFSDDGECQLLDGALLNRLAIAKLQAEAEVIRAEQGLPWVDAHLINLWSVRGEYRTCPTVAREPDAKTAFKLKKLSSRMESLCKQQDKLQDEDRYDESDALEDERLALEEEIDRLFQGLSQAVGPDAKRAGGVLILNGDGEPELIRHQLRRSEDTAPGKGKQAAHDEDDDQDDDEDTPAPVSTSLPRPLVKRLTAHRTAVGQAWLAAHPKEALCVLAADLIMGVWGNGRGYLGLSSRRAWPTREGDDVAESRAIADLARAEESVEQMLPETDEAEEMLDWLLEQPQERVIQVIAYCTAVQFDATSDSGYHHAAGLLRIFGIDMADWWEPTRAAYFDHVTVAQIEATVADACDDAQVQALSKLKGKDALAGRAEQMLAGKRWLPDVLKGE
jgi:ParB family chromosome partitioning protein